MRPAALLVVLLVSAAGAADKPQDFRYRVPLTVSGNAPYHRLTLPVAAYLQAAQPRLQDLRIFNSEGQAVPHARVAAVGTAENSLRTTRLRWFPLESPASPSATMAAARDNSFSLKVRQSADGTLVELTSRESDGGGASSTKGSEAVVRGYVLDASALDRRGGVQALTLDWESPATGFHLLDLEESDDLQHWRLLAGGIQLARLEYAGASIERRRVALAGISCRYLRLLWLDPFRAPRLILAEVEQSSMRWQNPALVWSAPMIPSAGPREGDYLFRLPQLIPLAGLRVDLPPGNFLMPLEVLLPGQDRRPEQLLGRAVLYRVTNRNREWVQEEFSVTGGQLKDFTLRVDRRSSSGLVAPRVSLAVQPEQVVFLAGGTPPYELAIGKAGAADAAMPLRMLVPDIDSPTGMDIGEARMSGAAEPGVCAPVLLAEAPQGLVQWKKLVLWGALVLGVLAMAAMAWQLLRQMNTGAGPGIGQ